MKCLVAGGTGFLGSYIAKRLQKSNHKVMAWGRKLQFEPNSDFDAVVSLAGEPVAQRWNDEVKQKIRDSRVLGTRNLVDAMSRLPRKPRVLVSASAIGIYGDRGDEILTESSPLGAGFLVDVCKGWEEEADRAAGLGIRVMKLRIGFVLGKNGGALATILPAFRAFAGGRLGSGKQWMPWIHVADIAELFTYAVENEVSGVWNATAPNPVRNTQFTEALASVVSRPCAFPGSPVRPQTGFWRVRPAHAGQHARSPRSGAAPRLPFPLS